MTIDAIYEGGVFKPTRPIRLKEGTHVRVLLEQHVQAPDPRRAAQLLAEIASLPLEGPGGFSGRDHDQVLYGEGHGA